MTSTLDCMPNVVETDSAPNLLTQTTARKRDPDTRFVLVSPYKSSGVRGTSNEFVRLPVENIPPPVVRKSWKYPEYVNFAERYASFKEWPKFLKGPNKTDLARSGFIYTEIGDKVTCFSCGWTLKNWEPFDDAYREHLRWSENCVFANMVTDGKVR
ncbi:E3 ubiquitin-protein ligase XIAP-like [Saccostrea cucullata]|uniref:E3 ubiquitin-protein ligase XIAP-like n=1 Tax=Saccostrea cuccullata TaxID=36930 RepID=UPI002ED07184